MNKKLMSWFEGKLRVGMFPTLSNSEGETSGSSGEGTQSLAEAPIDPEPEKMSDSDGRTIPQESFQTENPDEYIGSKEVNPESRPLKAFDRSGMSEQEIDDFIREAGPELFLSKEEIAKQTEGEKIDKKEEPAKEGETQKLGEETAFDEDAFLTSTGLSKDDFAKIPVDLQEKMANAFTVAPHQEIEKNEKYVALKTKLDATMKDATALLEDPIVAARLEERKTGNSFVARGLPAVNREELETLKSAQSEEEFEETLNKMIKSRAQSAIDIERSVRDKVDFNNKMFVKATKVMSEVAKMDKRLSGNVGVDNWAEITGEDHPDYAEFTKGPKKIVDYCIKYGLKNTNVASMSAKSLYAAIAADEGWQQEKEKNIAKSSVKKFLKSINDSANQAKSVSEGKRSSSSMSKNLSMEENRGSLVEKLVSSVTSGDSQWFKEMLDSAQNNPDKLDYLESVQLEATKQYREKMKNR